MLRTSWREFEKSKKEQNMKFAKGHRDESLNNVVGEGRQSNVVEQSLLQEDRGDERRATQGTKRGLQTQEGEEDEAVKIGKASAPSASKKGAKRKVDWDSIVQAADQPTQTCKRQPTSIILGNMPKRKLPFHCLSPALRRRFHYLAP
jgi:hypothetical protein